MEKEVIEEPEATPSEALPLIPLPEEEPDLTGTWTVDEDRMILKGGEGTVGGTYKLKRME